MPDVVDVTRFARDMWRRDDRHNEKDKSVNAEDRDFREWFGCAPSMAVIVWCLLVRTDLVPVNGELCHLLWTLLFLKCYPREHLMAVSCGADRQTVSKWVWIFLDALASLEPHVASFSFDNRHSIDQL